MSDDSQKRRNSADVHKLILSSLKPRMGAATAKMLAELTEHDADKPEVASCADIEPDYSSVAIRRVGKASELMVGWVDYMFDCFRQYEYDFNKTVSRADLAVKVERPLLIQEQLPVRAGLLKKVEFFKGQIVTAEWALVIRGQNELIEGFMLPVKSLESFDTDSSSLIRFLVMTPVNAQGKMAWRLANDVITWEELRSLSRQLFGSLIKVAKGELNFSTTRQEVEAAITSSPPQPMTAEEAIARLRQQAATADPLHQKASTPSASPASGGSTEALDALLERMRKKQDIKKMTGRTASRFRQAFGTTLPAPAPEKRDD